ncbi:hemK family modification methylase [Octadecabacter arcticus 238]|uniref:Release factor glutamine methyltransferase n=1 Tax=Octadecabacter arcticus 238 TaxID=391616 RepID=M9RRD3_9RHOB|nr:peptide chain release factor N(5)-glutamine methyltransferase [Octadecabacter arcticus]AGI72345.1 hemK family modification methylase [Octadecabacter arcticus 238]
MIVQAALAMAVQILKQAKLEDPVRDARVLMAACLDIPFGRLTLHAHDEFEDAPEAAFFADIGQRAARTPVSHLLGYRDFYGRRFQVTPDVLDPRGDTETLIEAALAVPFADVLDLGTGSGCILVTLLAERGAVTGIGVDVSPRAVTVAEQNALRLGVQDRCAFAVSDWFKGVGVPFDLIVSNPPYIALDEMAGLAPELGYEPRLALTDEGDGLAAYREITAGAAGHLRQGGWLMVEIGPTQGGAVIALFEVAGLEQVGIRVDLDGRDRVVVGKKPH